MNLSFFLQKGESLTDRVDAKTKVRDTLPWNQDGLFETNKIGQQRQSVAHNENRRSGSGEGTLAIWRQGSVNRGNPAKTDLASATIVYVKQAWNPYRTKTMCG